LNHRIAPIGEQHIEGFHAVFDSVARERHYLAFFEAAPLESVRKFVVDNIRSRNVQFVALVDDKVAGWCDVLPKPRPAFRHSGVLGMGVAEAFRGNGIGTSLIDTALRAAREKGMHRVELEVRADNARAIKLYQKFGFNTEGHMRHYMKINGKYYDCLLMAVLY
jgi:ribosomal protein S18 acetylase RimI-like enzyme